MCAECAYALKTYLPAGISLFVIVVSTIDIENCYIYGDILDELVTY